MKTQEEFWQYIAKNTDCAHCIVQEYRHKVDKDYYLKCESGYDCGSTMWALYSKIAKEEQKREVERLKKFLTSEVPL